MATAQPSVKEDHTQYDMIVIGAGWHGLIAAKVYLEQHPKEELLVLEAGDSCGGTWSSDRLYPGLHSNNLLGTYEYPDYPMSESYGVKVNEHIPGAVLHKYLTDFAKKSGIYTRIKFMTKVEHVSQAPLGGWFIESADKTQFKSKKLIIASGLTSSPNLPRYQGQETFGKYFHAKDFFKNADILKSAKSAVIIGSGKSAFDVAYAFADAGITAHLIVRPDGNGPAWMAQPWVMGGKKRLELLLSVRWMTWFSPCIFGGIDGWGFVRRFLHGTSIGRFIVSQFWGGLEGEVVDVNGYNKHPEVAKLKPFHKAFWIGSDLAIHNYPKNFFDMVKQGKIKVSKTDVDHLSSGVVHLTDGQELSADVLVAATGWLKDPTFAFQFDPVDSGPLQNPKVKVKLAEDANEEVFARLPTLIDQPLSKKPLPKSEPFRLYRFMIPAGRMSKRDLAFAGMISTASTASCATVQATWISMYLDNKLDIEAKTPQEIAKEIMLHTQWMRWRHPVSYGPSLPDMAFDALPYMDLLLKDLGLKVNRKPTIYKDVTEPYGPPDFAGLLEEWRDVHA